MKVNDEGQAAIMTTEQIEKILGFADPVSRLFLQLLRYTGERPSAVLKLKQNNCYYDSRNVREKIVIPRSIRKQAAGKKAKPRLVYILPKLKLELERYEKPVSELLFPSPRNASKSMTYHGMRDRFEKFLKKAKLENHNITLFSYRRTFIDAVSKGVNRGEDLINLTGHKNISGVMPYMEPDENIILRAMWLAK